MQRTKPTVSDVSLFRALAIGCGAIIVLLPFHAFFTTWLGATFGQIDTFRIWKEIAIFGLGLVVLGLIARDKKLRRTVFDNIIVQAILAYTAYTILRAGYGLANDSVNTDAALFGLIANLRFLAFFSLCWAVSLKTDLLYKFWQQLLVIPALVVIGFGLLQQFLLPKDFLEHFGYGPSTIPAYQAVDQKPDYIRAQSTLRGANPLGAYLVIISTFFAIQFAKLRTHKQAIWLLASLIMMFFTYSRSAWIGLAVSLFMLLLFLRPKQWRPIVLIAMVGIMLLGMFTYALRDNDMVQNVLFHSDETSLATQSSNEVRLNSFTNNLQDVWQEPLGSGIGSAGPASFRNNQPARIAENYYIQLAQEAGVIGLALYICISALVVKGLWLRRHDTLALVLIASFAGLTAVNMISHAWMDDTLALLWWGLAGIALATISLNKSKKAKV